MGCTGSAPSMDGYISDSYSASMKNVNTTDAEQNKESGSKDMKSVLPSSDNLEKNLELASQNTIKNVESLEEPHVETVTKSFCTCKRDENKIEEKQTTNIGNSEHNTNEYENQNEEHYATLREVVDKVMLDNTILQINEPSNDEVEDYDYDDKDDEKSIADSDPPSETIDIEVETKAQENQEDRSEEGKSPSQSECGRATRWEALADIAAELPPTLAVDPITGQIYSLAK